MGPGEEVRPSAGVPQSLLDMQQAMANGRSVLLGEAAKSSVLRSVKGRSPIGASHRLLTRPRQAHVVELGHLTSRHDPFGNRTHRLHEVNCLIAKGGDQGRG
jgi:hypothetical protein